MEQVLYDHRGEPIDLSKFKKSTPPKLGEAFGDRWSSNGLDFRTLPGGGVLQFDLNRLSLADFRLMRDHYQINASLSVLSFMMHQLDWKIVSDDERVKKHCQDNMAEIWTRLVRALSQAFWAGYSPNVLQWENDLTGKKVMLTKVKDLVPESSLVNWKFVDGWAPPGGAKPKLPVYDGIKQIGAPYAIPTENTLWYPLLMENGDWYGRKLLRPAFTSWYFSILIHLFSNRYFERFGEPVPVGRAPYDEELDINGKKVAGTSVMMGILQNLRNRSAVVMPSQRTVTGTTAEYDYTIEYLESQMRGADFERYLMRLDEEMSLAMFTPLLMLRTADVGSYNLGTQHSQVYMQMLNAISGDWKQYIDAFVLDRMVDFNFGPNAKRAKIVFRKLGDDKFDLVKAILQALLTQNVVKPNMEELGNIAGLTLEEREILTEPTSTPPPAGDDSDGGQEEEEDNPDAEAARRVVSDMYARVVPQIQRAFREGTFGNGFSPDLGHRRQLESALGGRGVGVHGRMTAWLEDLVSSGVESFANVEECLRVVKTGLSNTAEEVMNGTNEA